MALFRMRGRMRVLRCEGRNDARMILEENSCYLLLHFKYRCLGRKCSKLFFVGVHVDAMRFSQKPF